METESGSGDIGFLLKPNQPDAVEVCTRLAQAVRARGLRELVIVAPGEPSPVAGLRTVEEHQLPERLRMVVVLGGDGTTLYCAGLLGLRSVPILGVIETMSGFGCGSCGSVTSIFGEGGARKLAAGCRHLPVGGAGWQLTTVHRHE